MQNNLEEQINNKSSFSSSLQFPLPSNYSKNIIQDKANIVKLLSDYIKSRIHTAQSILLISSQHESLGDNIFI